MAGLPHHWTIVAVDIERSTTHTNPIKAELLTTLYQLFDAALRSAGICERHRDRFIDRGEGALTMSLAVSSVPGPRFMHSRAVEPALAEPQPLVRNFNEVENWLLLKFHFPD